jgi:ubiquinone/menaquinone biosynthesis C-methylase UbiE
MKKHSRYIPAFRFHRLTRWYDPMMQVLFPEEESKTALILQGRIQAGQVVLDMGCGTGTLTLLIKKIHPNTDVYGLDRDSQVLNIARRKIERTGEAISLQHGTATCLPYANESFDHVFASLALHHLTRQDKQQALREAFRVLKPGGKLHVVDFGKPHDLLMWLISLVVRWFEEIHDHIMGLLPVFIADAGFHWVEVTRHRTITGTMAVYCASKPK